MGLRGLTAHGSDGCAWAKKCFNLLEKNVVGAVRLCYYSRCLQNLGLPHIVATGCQPQKALLREPPLNTVAKFQHPLGVMVLRPVFGSLFK